MNAAIIVAGGSGVRTGLAGGKQLISLAGHPVLYHAIAAFAVCPAVDEIVVVVHPERIGEYTAAAVEPLGSPKVVAVVAGGDTRQESVAAGLAAISTVSDVIMVHDGARPLVTPDLITDAIAALEADPSLDGVVVGHPSCDTLKLVDSQGRVSGTLDRALVWAAQTPQIFRAAALHAAYASAAASGALGTDDASLVERAGGAIAMFTGPRDNLKITVPEDLLVVERLLEARAEARER